MVFFCRLYLGVIGDVVEDLLLEIGVEEEDVEEVGKDEGEDKDKVGNDAGEEEDEFSK